MKSKMIIAGIVILLMMAVFSTGCIDEDDGEYDLRVVVSIPPQREWVEEIGGEGIKVTVMVPPGSDPHTYEPTSSQMVDVSEADIYFKVGAGMEFEERWMDTLIEYNEDMRIVDGSEGVHLLDYESHHDHEFEHLIEDIDHIIHEWEDGHMTAEDALEAIDDLIHQHEEDDHEQEHLIEDIDHIIHEWEYGNVTAEGAMEAIEDLIHQHEEDEHGHEGDDPHIWLSPVNAKMMINDLLNALIEVDPDNADIYNENAGNYLDRLNSLHEEVEEALHPHHGRKFLIYHPSMNYFAHEYGLVQIGVEREGQEPGASGLAAVIEQAKEENIRVVFVSPQFDESNAQTIADEIDGEVITLNPLAEKYIENIEDITSKLVDAFSE